jgi:hypothetical protein
MIAQGLLAHMQLAAQEAGPNALAYLHLATLPKIVQDRMRMHFAWIDSFREYLDNSTYWSVQDPLYERYNHPGQPIWEFRNWMNRNFIRPGRQEIAIWRVLLPLLAHKESGGIEPTWRDWVDVDEKGEEIDVRLVEFLRKRCDSEQEALKVRGNDLHRARISQVSPDWGEDFATDEELPLMILPTISQRLLLPSSLRPPERAHSWRSRGRSSAALES